MHALGAAIPHLLLLTVSLPAVLPFPREVIHTHITTDTRELHDEIIPEDENEDIRYQIRGKSALKVIICIGDAPLPQDPKPVIRAVSRAKSRKNRSKKAPEKDKAPNRSSVKQSTNTGGGESSHSDDMLLETEREIIVVSEGEQEEN